MKSIVKRSENIEWKEEDGIITLIIKLKSDNSSKSLFSGLVPTPKERKIELDEIGTFVWKQIGEGATVENLIEKLADNYDLHWKEAETSMLTFLGMLARKGLIKILPPQGQSKGNDK
ncbi:MAG TPA: PqqD family protein [Euryarchaeota archaeon]|nr:PqqD family protein [Euryarchaeota archaeon]